MKYQYLADPDELLRNVIKKLLKKAIYERSKNKPSRR
jgi:hypothetical protein